MQKFLLGFGAFCICVGYFASPARADFMIASAIVEFTEAGPRQQDVELISRSKDNDYIEAEISEIVHPGEKNESRRAIEDPASAGLLVTPDKTVLAGGGRKVMRFVLLREPDAEEHIYRVAIKPVIKGIDTSGKVGLKILVGYEVLVIVRPAMPVSHYTATREGRTITVQNSGNTNIIFQNGKQCTSVGNCVVAPALRVYPGLTAHLDLPAEGPVQYSIWNGSETTEQRFE